MSNLPFIVSGTIEDTDATNPNGAKVILRNDTNGETTSTTTNSSGQYVLDAANLTSGYLETDSITIYCAWGLADGEESFLISSDTHTADITLVTVEDSATVTYCTVQDVYDELGDKTTSDISFNRIRKSILRAEKEIEERTETKFSSTTVTEEIHDFNQYTSYKSPESLYFPRTTGYGSYGRGDNISGFMGSDTISLNFKPIISITSLYKNTAGDYQTDSWTELTEQTGSGGDFITYLDIGIIKFVNSGPYFGKRKIKVTYTYGYATVPRTIERLTILLVCRDVLVSKANSSQFDSVDPITLEGISVAKGISGTVSYFNWLNEEIERLWKIVGDMINQTA